MDSRIRDRGVVVLGGLAGLALAGCSQSVPFAVFTLSGLSPDAAAINVRAQLGGTIKTASFTNEAPLDRFSVGFPAGTRGVASFDVSALDKDQCIAGTAAAQLLLEADQEYAQALTLTAITPPACVTPGQASLIVRKQGDGQGVITSSPPGIDCKLDCPAQNAGFAPGARVTLTAMPSTAPGRKDLFLGWSGSDCTGTGPCTVTLAQAALITASFACRGFCNESPAAEQNDLYGVWGSGPSSVVAVGDKGTILRWDGSAWKRVPSGVSVTLRAISGVLGGPRMIAVGDGGTILDSPDDGKTWTTRSAPITQNLRGVWVSSATEAYAAGDQIGPDQPYITWNGTAWSVASLTGFGATYHAVHGFRTGHFLIAGNTGATIRGADGMPTRTPAVPSTVNLYGAWGSDELDQYVVGDSGMMFYFDESQLWRVLPIPSGAQRVSLRSVFGTNPTTIYAAGDAGTVWRHDTTSGTAMPTGFSTHLRGIWAIPDGNLYTVGQGGLILHYRP